MRDDLLGRAALTAEGLIGLSLLVVAAALALAAPLLLPGDPFDIVARPLLRPLSDPAHLLGTDRLGRDILAMIVHGARPSLITALSVAAVALGVGMTAGAVAGMLGGVADEVIMRLADAVQTVPSFVVALAVLSVLGPSLPGLIAALAVSAWTAPARVVRSEVLRLRGAPFVESSLLLGRGRIPVALTVVLPNAITVALALSAVIVAGALLSEAALSFLGLGDPNRPSWGALIAEGRQVMRTAPHVIIAPGMALFLTVLGVSLVGEGLAKALSKQTS
ncbi:MAG: ABC transporter permease [Hyphomicrobiales bacterium]|jgi:peptide/nickel transport system permease protein|nr:ABC transporter permease [Hyphomicrobiales bacterium]